MIDEDSKEITELIRPFIKKYPSEGVIQVIKDIYLKMNDEDKKEITNSISPFVKKYPLEEVIQVIDDTYSIFDPRKNPDILIRDKGNSEKN